MKTDRDTEIALLAPYDFGEMAGILCSSLEGQLRVARIELVSDQLERMWVSGYLAGRAVSDAGGGDG